MKVAPPPVLVARGPAPALPIVHIDQLAESLGLTRDWINRRWLNADDPPPYFRDGDAVFFPIKSFAEWAERRANQVG